MKLHTTITLLAALAASVVLASQATSSAAAVAVSTSQKTGVRGEIVDLDGNHPHTSTTFHLVNTSESVPLTVERVVALGPGGRDDVLKVLNVFADTVIPPLGEMRIRLDVTTPGFPVQTSPLGYGMRNLVVAWDGAPDALSLSSAIVRHYADDEDNARTIAIERGYPILD